MTPTPLQLLVQTAQFLRNAAPREFDQFRDAFGKYTSEALENLLAATTNLPQVQGQAQQCAKLYSELEKIK